VIGERNGRGGNRAIRTQDDLPRGRHAMTDHLHLVLGIPPKYSVAHTVGFLKARALCGSTENCCGAAVVGLHFRAVGYCVSTVGLDEAAVGSTSEQEKLDSGRTSELRVTSDGPPGLPPLRPFSGGS